MGDDGTRLTQAEWIMAEVARQQAAVKAQLDEAKRVGQEYDDLLARGRSVLGASTNEEYFTKLGLLIHQHNEYYAMLVGRAVAESMYKAFTITMNPN